jgi:hypothetical protein
MPHRFLHPQIAGDFSRPAPDRSLLRDIVWDRPVFRPPGLPNPRVVFDPPPFRTQLFSAARRACRIARR